MDCGLCDRPTADDEPVEDWVHEHHGFWVWVCPQCQARAAEREAERKDLLNQLGLIELRSRERV